jgi:6-phosphogluconolactonase/glucosamine-6-phosphate isomerase/deaminase
MKFILTTGWDDGVADLTERLAKELTSGKRVLWLVSGGSNTEASVHVMDSIAPKLSAGLLVMPVDERYGAPGHADSNWSQLMKAGFKCKKAKCLPVLKKGLNLKQTAAYYEELAREAFANSDMVVAQLGIGDDGHIAGILPGSPAVLARRSFVSGYATPNYKRLTLTFPALQKVNAAYVFAFGGGKGKVLRSLRFRARTPQERPAQILKTLPEAYIYNDQVGSYAR